MDQKFQDQEKEETLASPGVFDKYHTAGKIANTILEAVIKKCIPDADISEICAYGDNELNSELQKVYNKKNMEKGIAFPTCVSPNHICGHFSPLKSESQKLNAGDVAKIELGVHIDGYIAIVGHTIVVGQKQVEGRQADVILAAYKGVQAAFRLLKAGGHNTQVTEAIEKITTSYGCSPLEGVLSHDLKRHFIDGNKVILNKETQDQHVEDQEFSVNDVFALDVIVSTGEGKSKESEYRTTVFKRALEHTYQLKTKNGRAFMAEVIQKYPALCFSLRLFEEEVTAKMAVQECSKHDLLNPYPVLIAPNDIVAQFTITVAILSTSTLALTGLPLLEEDFKTEKKITDEAIIKLLDTAMDKNAQKKSKKSKTKVPTEEKSVS